MSRSTSCSSPSSSSCARACSLFAGEALLIPLPLPLLLLLLRLVTLRSLPPTLLLRLATPVATLLVTLVRESRAELMRRESRHRRLFPSLLLLSLGPSLLWGPLAQSLLVMLAPSRERLGLPNKILSSPSS